MRWPVYGGILMTLLILIAALQQETPLIQRLAMLVGVGDYAGLQALLPADKNLVRMRSILQDSFGFRSEDVETLPDERLWCRSGKPFVITWWLGPSGRVNRFDTG